jgi:hypothetical protein
MAKEKTNTFTARELGAVLNNAVAMAQATAKAVIPELRMRRLAAYALALITPVTEDLKEGLLMPEEAVFVLSSAALIIHARDVQETDKLPFLRDAHEALTEAEALVLEEATNGSDN